MSTSQIGFGRRYTIALLAVGITFLVLFLHIGLAQSAPQQGKRTFENKTPPQVPLKIKIKNKKEDKALDTGERLAGPTSRTMGLGCLFGARFLKLPGQAPRDRDCAGGVAVAGDGDAVDVCGKGIGAHAFGPLDDDDRTLVGEELVEIDGVCGARAFVETIEIEMVELQTTGVGIHESERRAGHVFLIDAERRADAFDEECLACAQWSAE